MKRVRSVVGLLVAAAVSGCSESDMLAPADIEGGGLLVDSAAYHVEMSHGWYHASIGVAFTNPFTVDVQIPGCKGPHPPLLEKRTSGGWRVAYSPIVLLCLEPPLIIGPGETYSMIFHLGASLEPNKEPQFEAPPISGMYRLNWAAISGPSMERVPERFRASQPFELIES